MSKQSGQVSLAKDYLRGATKQLEKARAAGVDLSALVPLLTALIELAAEVLPELVKRKDGLEEAIERAARELPEGWSVHVETDIDDRLNANRVSSNLYKIESGDLELIWSGPIGTPMVNAVATCVEIANKLSHLP